MATFSALSLEMTKGQQYFVPKRTCFPPPLSRRGLKDSAQHEGGHTDLHWEFTSARSLAQAL